MIINKAAIERDLEKFSPLPLQFEWSEPDERGCALRITVPIQTQAGFPQVFIALPPKMPSAYMPRAIARAKALIIEIFDANMVGIRFTAPPKRKPQIIMPAGHMMIGGQPS